MRGPAALLCFPSEFTAIPETHSILPTMTGGPGSAPFLALSSSTECKPRFDAWSEAGTWALHEVSHNSTRLSDPQDAIKLPLGPP
jgi:hypothetical protein